VRSWSGANLLGGGDGAALAEPERMRSKLETKGAALEAILGYPVEAPLTIDYVADHGEWKTAWDHIGFEGFLGTRMRMQFTWEGCDSALAAPLIIDLARLVARAHASGQRGVLPTLGFFFKDPLGGEQRLDRQFTALCDWASRLGQTW
jgi:myo-inositol-1-phosphate synthase